MLDDNTKKFLLTIEPFQYLNKYELETILAYSKLVDFKANQIILHQGKKSEGMYIILKGHASVKARILGEGMVNLASIGEGSFAGEISMIDKVICTATVSAIDNVSCLLLLSDYFDMLSKFFPELRYKIMKGITQVVYNRLIITQENIQALMQSISASPSLTSLQYIQQTNRVTKINFKEIGINPQRLRKSTLFSQFTNEEYSALLDHCQFIHVPKRCLISNHQTANEHYIIFRGAIQAAQLYETQAAKLAVMAPYAQFGKFFSDKSDYIAYFSCEEAILMRFSADNLVHLQSMNAQLWYKIYDSICHSIIALEKFAYKFYIRLSGEFHDTKG